MTTSLACPHCGAAAPSIDAARCAYCGSVLTAIGCPSCFGTMFAGMQFCPHCGARAARVVDESAPPLVCPGCRAAMHAVAVGSTPFHECTECASVWLETATFTQLCMDREQRSAIGALIGAAPTDVNPTVGLAVRYVPCPTCTKVMNRENFGRRSGVVIDVCKQHGVWFERGELHSVIRFIESGAFTEAK